MYFIHTIDRDTELKLNRDHKRQHLYVNYKNLENRRDRENFNPEYSKKNIIELINKYFDCSFTEMYTDNYDCNVHSNKNQPLCFSPGYELEKSTK